MLCNPNKKNRNKRWRCGKHCTSLPPQPLGFAAHTGTVEWWHRWRRPCCCCCQCQIIPCLCLHVYPDTCTVSLHISTKNLWCEDYHIEATRCFWFHAAGRRLAAAHHHPLHRPNDVVWAPRGGDEGGCRGREGVQGKKMGEGGRRWRGVTYLHRSAAFLLIKTPICVFEVRNESVWLRGGTGRK